VCSICLFSDNDTSESIDRVYERNRTDLRMKLKRNTVNKEDKGDKKEEKKIYIYSISDKQTKTFNINTARNNCFAITLVVDHLNPSLLSNAERKTARSKQHIGERGT